MRPGLGRQLVEFGRTIRLSHSLFALPFALGAALLADPPYPDGWSLALVVACMVAARTSAMGMNRVADAALDARNPRTRGRAIPAGRLSRRAALGLTLASGAAFLAMAWLFLPVRGNAWPGWLAPALLAVLLAYSWTKRVTVATHWVLGLCLGLAPVAAWIALCGSVSALPIAIGAAVLFWTAGFDILYALQDEDVDRREKLHSIPGAYGRRGAQAIAAGSHLATVVLFAVVLALGNRLGPAEAGRPPAVMGWASLIALVTIAVALAVQHALARRATPERIAARFFWLNALVSILWLGGVIADLVLRSRRYGSVID